jgi:PPOX class probable F420-dependent enzyme
MRVARLATVGGDGRPHLVPIVFAIEGERLYFAVDAKPKRTRDLQRLRNIVANPAVAILFDDYDDTDWSRLWWVRAEGEARIVEDGPEFDHALDLLTRRYPQYERSRPVGPVVVVSTHRWSGWSAS